MRYWVMNRIISGTVFAVLILLSLFFCVSLFWYLTGVFPASFYRFMLPEINPFYYLPRFPVELPGMFQVLIPFGLFFVLLRLCDMLYRRIREGLYHTQVIAYQKARQARCEVRRHS